MAELIFHTGPMDSGKSTLALQMDHAQSAHDRQGVRYAMHVRSGGARITSRIGLSVEAVEVTDSLDLYQDIVSRLSRGGRIDYLICDEAQFYRTKQIDQLARVVDDLDIDVYCFGILADFRTELFPDQNASLSWPTASLSPRSHRCAGAAVLPPIMPGSWMGSWCVRVTRSASETSVVDQRSIMRFYAAVTTVKGLPGKFPGRPCRSRPYLLMAPGPDEHGPRVRVRSRIFPRWVGYQVCGVGPPNMISSQEGIDARLDLRGLRFLRGRLPSSTRASCWGVSSAA